MLNLSASGRGTIQDPQLEANLSLQQLVVHDYPISNLSAQVTVAHEHANLTMRSAIDQGSVEGKADVGLTGQRDVTAG